MISNFQWIGQSPDKTTVTLKRFDGQFKTLDYATPEWIALNQDLIRVGAVLDTETTGFNRNRDVVIEIGIRLFSFNKSTGELIKILDSYSGLQDPGFTLSKEITMITGLTNYILKDHAIDWKRVDDILEKADIIIAHNAQFDRPFVEQKSATSSKKIWGCSIKQINWTNKGYSSAKLELLSIYHGYFTDAHRALNDSDSLLHLLSFTDAQTKHPYLNELLENARRPMTKVSANYAPFESKDLLKERSYSWDNTQRIWYKTLFTDELKDELAWLESAVYKGAFKGQALDIPLTNNFKA